jgi:hypothetical protein
MDRVSITFVAGGKCEVRDETGAVLPVDRAVIYLAAGNAHPVALLHMRGERWEGPVQALDVSGLGGVETTDEIIDEALPLKKR